MLTSDKSASYSPWVRFSRSVSLAGGVCVAQLGITVLLGWLWNLPALKRVAPSLPNMAFNAALAFVAAGGSLLAQRVKASSRQAWRGPAACALAVLVFAIGALTLTEFLTGHDLGIDQLA